jgi:hypothetical protein
MRFVPGTESRREEPLETQRSQAASPIFWLEFLTSLNVAFPYRWVLAQIQFSNAETFLQLRINGYLHIHPHSSVGGYGAFFIVAVGLAGCIFAALSVSSLNALLRRTILFLAGPISVSALPISWLYVSYRFPNLFHVPPIWPLAETVVAILCSGFYLLRTRPRWPWGALVIFHFGFWAWLFLGGIHFWLSPVKLVFPLVGLSAVLAWGSYISGRARAHFLP